MSGIQQMLTGGTYKPAGPTTIGQAWGGGFYAGKISTTANNVATHYLIVAPKSSGQAINKTWGPYVGYTSINSVIDGPSNSATLAALGTAYQAATFCEGLTIGGYSDWYLPAKDEMTVIYYFLKPGTNLNDSNSGATAYSVAPEPRNTNYTQYSPSQTSAGINFRDGESEAFTSSGSANFYWTSTATGGYGAALVTIFDNGQSVSTVVSNLSSVRAVRRIPV